MYSYYNPIKYIENNLIFNTENNCCWAVFKMPGFNYEYKSIENKKSIRNRLARFLANVGIEAKILIVPVSQDVDMHYKNLTSRMDKSDALYEKAKGHAAGTCQYLKAKIERNGSVNDYVTYVIPKLKLQSNIINDIKDALTYFVQRPLQSICEFFSANTKDILQREIELFENLVNEYLKEQAKRVYIKKADSLDIQWLLRRMYRRGLGEVQLRYRAKGANGEEPWSPFSERVLKDGQKAIRPHKKDILTLSEGLIEDQQDRCIKITNSDGAVSWQTFLAVAHIPDVLFPDNEWLLVLQDYPVQTEVCIHIDTVEHKKSIRDIGGKRREIKSQIEHIYENDDDIPDDLADSKEYADMLESELKATRAPILRVSVTFCISGASREELEDNVRFIKETYEDFNFVIERPVTDQLKLFMECIPGTGRYVSDYIMPMPPRVLGSSMFGATRMLGDNEGPYIGFVGKKGIIEKNVFLNLARACLLNRSASIALLGTLGGGKSFNANLLIYLHVLYYGAMALIFDPKGERTNWVNDLPELKDYISIITLSAGKDDRGKLDPWLIYRDNPEDAGELALNILAELFKLDPNGDDYFTVQEAINYTKKLEKRSMEALVQRLLNFSEDDELKHKAKMMGRKINALKEAGMAGLLFGTGDEEGLNIKNRVNVLQIQNLSLPDPVTPKEDYTLEERISTVLMLPIASFAKKFAMSDRSVFKIVEFDESWALSATQMGIKLMNFLSRMGRSLFAACIFIGHSVKDLKGEGIKNAITYKFCFKTDDNDEVLRVLDFLDLELTEDNINEVKSLENRQCLFKDLDNRVGRLTFDAGFEHLIKAFDTTPKEKKVGGGSVA